MITSVIVDSNSVFICDFNDSFTYNIYADLKKLGANVVVFRYDDSLFWNYLKLKQDSFVLVLGPGPGNVSDYKEVHDLIKSFLFRENTFLFGICLGHQLLMYLLGHSIVKSSSIKHGTQTVVDLNEIFPGRKVVVQRYNSLTVKLDHELINPLVKIYDEDKELSICLDKRLLSLQFHPESIGTSCPNRLYNIALDFLL
ncbi:MAG: aminodeoxychorismate/anthranilate synthase component II [Bacteriovoracaceae bacterium]|nr:aminodeoxychorismate/anthranilate synthase component II [Bacteriovoracaceae bacterium]